MKRTRGGRPILKMSAAEAAVHEVMSSIPLKPGDMLLFGPKSVKILSTEGMFEGVLPDKHVIPKSEWEHINVQQSKPKRRSSGAGGQR